MAPSFSKRVQLASYLNTEERNIHHAADSWFILYAFFFCYWFILWVLLIGTLVKEWIKKKLNFVFKALRINNAEAIDGLPYWVHYKTILFFFGQNKTILKMSSVRSGFDCEKRSPSPIDVKEQWLVTLG